MARVALENVTKTYGQVTAVADLSLEVADREFVVLVGPSGCGKSTTLRMIAGLDEPTSGEIRIGDRVVNGVPAKDRNIAMVFQSYALYPHMTVYNNMAFSLRMRKIRRAEIDRRVRDAARILDMEPLLGRLPAELSGGQKQRAALGRSIVREPLAFLMDEPLSNLDAKLRAQMRTEISRLHRQLGTTTIYVTHDQTEAMTMGDRIVVMKDGVVQQVARPQEIYEHPANVFVAGFIGSPQMNFLRCRVEAGKLTGPGFTTAVPGEREAALRPYEGREVIIGLRPEDISDSPVDFERWGAAGVPPATVEAQVDLVEPLGAEVILYLLFDGQPVTARVTPRTGARVGGKLRVALHLAQGHLFDPVTEKASD